VIRLKSLGKECLSACNKFYPSRLVCINLKPLSFIIVNSDIDFLSSPSTPITPVLSVGLGTEMTLACEIPLDLFAIKLILTFINSNLTADQVEGSVQGVVDLLQHSSSILTGSSFLQISIFSF
jgi:hypothetical protein